MRPLRLKATISEAPLNGREPHRDLFAVAIRQIIDRPAAPAVRISFAVDHNQGCDIIRRDRISAVEGRQRPELLAQGPRLFAFTIRKGKHLSHRLRCIVSTLRFFSHPLRRLSICS